MDELPAYILDAFAFMAYIQGEPAAQNVKKNIARRGTKQMPCLYFHHKRRRGFI